MPSQSSLLNSIVFHLAIGFLIRTVLILYGDYHDKNNSVHYTDVDYHVITDAARHVSSDESPFLRHTYRYTPFLAFLMLPNIWLHFLLGKFIFSLFDALAALVIYKSVIKQGFPAEIAVKCSLLWLYNPLVIGISTRGSPESVIVTIVLMIVYFHQLERYVISGCALGLAVHFKLYPIIYSIPLYLSIEKRTNFSMQMFYPSKARIQFTAAAIFSFLSLTLYGIYLYGEPYIDEGFLYHVSRVDTRHNFSIYFYLLYLSVDYSIPGLGIATFAPQFILVCAYGAVYGTRRDFILAMFAQTMSFVTFNKVVTSQYFIWYLVFVPLLATKLQLSRFKTVFLPLLWVLAQAAWLLPAYLFEFKGINVFIPIWLESVAFFCCNVGILMSIITSYSDSNKIKLH